MHEQTVISVVYAKACVFIVILSKMVDDVLALKRELYHLSSLCNINRTACLL